MPRLSNSVVVVTLSFAIGVSHGATRVRMGVRLTVTDTCSVRSGQPLPLVVCHLAAPYRIVIANTSSAAPERRNYLPVARGGDQIFEIQF